MNIENELQAMQKRMFGGNLQDHVLASVQLEIKTAHFDISEQMYREAVAALSSALDRRQMYQIKRMEMLSRENFAYGLRFSVLRGIYAGARGYVIEKGFEELVEEPLLYMPAMEEQTDYYVRNESIMDIEEELRAVLPSESQRRVTAVALAWEERIYGALHHGFALGYCFGASLLGGDTGRKQTIRAVEKQLLFPDGWFTSSGD